MVGKRGYATLLRNETVVGLRAAHGCCGKSCPVLKTFGGIDAEHGFTQIGMQLVEYRFAPTGRYVPDNAGNDAAYAVALRPDGRDKFFHGESRRRVRATHGVVVDVREVVLVVVARECDRAYLRGVSGYRDTHAMQYLQGDGACYATYGRFASRCPASAPVVAYAVFGRVGKVGMRRAEEVLQVVVVLAAAVAVAYDETDGGTGTLSLENTREKLYIIVFVSLCGNVGLPRTTTAQEVPYLFHVEPNAGGQPVYDAAYCRAVRFAKGSEPV